MHKDAVTWLEFLHARLLNNYYRNASFDTKQVPSSKSSTREYDSSLVSEITILYDYVR